MRRSDVVQSFLNLFESPLYLEIGVDLGETFHALVAERRIAVDPHMKFDVQQARCDHSNAVYHEVTSDEFFSRAENLTCAFDVVYVDGLHTYEQTLRDTLNAIATLSHDGVVVIDDTRPSSYSAAAPNLEDAIFLKSTIRTESLDGSWMGDVYRVVAFLRHFHQQFSYATVQENHGQTVVWRERRQMNLHPTMSVEETARLSFLDITRSPEILQIMPHSQILEKVKSARLNN